MPHLAERLQNLGDVLGGDTDTCVRHSEGDIARICFLVADGDCAAFGGKANRVG